ncbi:MAG: DegT/DnrJ/EryC1/StrS family aminotransferase [Chthonomonadales bacterium]|nr:DegT/DnrJ/EryC1/StrS family aminotransferase [Chthonomonadales bacterium]
MPATADATQDASRTFDTRTGKRVKDDQSSIPFALPDITEAEIEAVSDSVRSGWLTTGPNSAAFEKEFASFLGDGLEAVAVNSATAGLHLAVEALGLGPDDEVLVPTWTFTSTAEVVRYVGANPVLVDVEPGSLNIDFAAAERAITERTRAILPVHFAGLPVPRGDLSKFASSHGLEVVEDAAHAFPVISEGRLVGDSESAAVVFSFYATKTMTTGEGGMLVTRRPEIAERARTMRLHGISRDVFDRYTSTKPNWHYEVVAPGYKYNLPDPAAAIGRVQLRRSKDMTAARQRIAERYNTELAGLPLQLPAQPREPGGHAWHVYAMRLADDAPVSRDRFVERMAEMGVGTSVHFIPLHMHPYWRDTLQLKCADFPVASEVFNRVVSLPIFSAMTDRQIERVIRSVHKALASSPQEQRSTRRPDDPEVSTFSCDERNRG